MRTEMTDENNKDNKITSDNNKKKINKSNHN